MITAFEKLIHIKALELSECPHWNILPWHERQALQDLAKDPNTVIKKVDKGGGIVILDKDVYLVEVNRQLADTQSYREIPSDPMKRTRTGTDCSHRRHNFRVHI